MNVTERRMQIFDLLKKNEVVELNELAKRFQVSTMTIRRDLQMFERQGVLHMSYGEAYLNKQSVHEPSFAAKSEQNVLRKQNIGYHAAQFVEDGDTIVLDCGTTPLQMLPFLEHKRVTVITNSWPSAHYAGGNSKIKLIFAPGEYYETSAGMTGVLTEEFFARIHADKVFMGGHGFSVENGVMEPDIEFNSKKAVMAAGKEKFLLVDSTKYEKTYLMKYADLSEFHHIITDSYFDMEKRAELESVCKDVIFASR